MRKWLIQKLLNMTLHAVFILSPKRPWPEKTSWKVDFGGVDIVHVLFYCSEDFDDPFAKYFTNYHTVCIVETRGKTVLIDGVAKRLVVVPLTDAEKFIKRASPDYFVEVHTKIEHEEGRYLPDIYSCVTVAKKLIGIGAPWIVTPEQLLGALWEVRHVVRS